MPLTDRQLEAIEHEEGPCRVLAGPGSGKTTIIAERYAHLVRELGYPAHRILTVTFTAQAGREMRGRCEDASGLRTKSDIGTMHSRFMRILNDSYGEQEVMSPSDRLELYFDIHKSGLSYLSEVRAQDALDLIDQWRRSMLTPGKAHEAIADHLRRQGMTEVLDLDIDARGAILTDDESFAMGLRQVTEAYRQFQIKKQELGLIDFADMIYETWRLLKGSDRTRARWQQEWDFVQVDEFQDIDRCQLEIVKMITADHTNLLVVGDDDQCCPPGTPVRVEGGEDVPIEQIANGDHVMAYSVRGANVLGRRKGYPAKVSKRHYSGRMWEIALWDGHYYEATTNHRCIARWSEISKVERWYCVYLMQRTTKHGRQDWRVGWCQLRRADGSLHLNVRLNLDRGDRMWVLHATRDPAKASLMESVVATKYRISTVTFSEPSNATHYTQENLDSFWDRLDSDELIDKAALERDLNISLDHPLLNRRSTNTRGKVVFEIHPSNVIAGLHEMATDQGGKIPGWIPVNFVSNYHYEGEVFSLDVATHKTFLAGGVVTHNSIYGFRGASPDSFVQMEETFPDTKTIVLDQNFRSADEIVRRGCQMIANNDNRVPKEVHGTEKDAQISLSTHPTTRREAIDVAERISTLLEQGVQPQEIAIIYRTNDRSLPFESALEEAGIPCSVRSGGTFFDLKEIAPLVAYFEIAANMQTLAAIDRIANWPNRGIPLRVIRSWHEFQTKNVMKMLEASVDEISGVQALRDDIVLLQMDSAGKTSLGLLELILKQFNYVHVASRMHGFSGPDDPDLSDLLEQLREVCRDTPEPNDFVRRVRRSREFAKRRLRREDAVQLVTFHTAKGLEFDAVFLTGMCEGVIPHKKSIKEGNIEEERRLAYVGWTRSKRLIHVTSPISSGPLSRFIDEWRLEAGSPSSERAQS